MQFSEMYKYIAFVFCSLIAFPYVTAGQLCRLNAHYEEITSRVIIDWNMISHTAKTTYILLRSNDTKTWTEIVTDKIFQMYSAEDVFDYDDKVNRDQKYFYRLKIIDTNNKTIAFSNIVSINTGADKGSWVIYPNPVNDILHLAYQGNDVIKGVINVTVQDITGKIVIRFRAASINKLLEIPVSQLRKGVYVVQISILNEIIMNHKLVKP